LQFVRAVEAAKRAYDQEGKLPMTSQDTTGEDRFNDFYSRAVKRLQSMGLVTMRLMPGAPAGGQAHAICLRLVWRSDVAVGRDDEASHAFLQGLEGWTFGCHFTVISSHARPLLAKQGD
jgi:hypothetical protein